MDHDPIFERFLTEAERMEQHRPLHRLHELDEHGIRSLDEMGFFDLPDEQSYTNIFDADGERVYLAREVRRGNLCRYQGKGIWHAGWGTIRAEDLHDVTPVEGHKPFALAIPWTALVCDGSGEWQEATVTGWDGDCWTTSRGRVRFVDEPIPAVRTLDDEWRV
jgi:hypothetical protein